MQQDIDKFDLTLDLINKTSANIFLTGKAGTGKTTFLNYLRDNCGKAFAVAAPTGIAAINAKGVTLHSLFQLPFCPFLPDKMNVGSKISLEKEILLRKLQLLIIDEVSMLRADLLDAIDYRLRKVRRDPAPFGGVQLLLIGDLFQLPPVAVAEEEEELKKYYGSMFFFESKALKKTFYITVELDKVFRQENKEFKDILNSVRAGYVSKSQLDMLNQRYIPDFVPEEGVHYVRLVTHNKQVDEINQKEMNLLAGEEHRYDAQIKGVFPETSYPVAPSIPLKVGAHVMFSKNNTEKGYYNGLLGVVTALEDDGVTVMLQSGKEIIVVPEIWDNIEYKVVEVDQGNEEGQTKSDKKRQIVPEVIGFFSQIPLRLAWAISVHKSQGLTFDRAIIDVSRSFAAGQTYVALSRCRTLEGIVLSNTIGWRAIKCERIVQAFYKKELEGFPLTEEKNTYLRNLGNNALRSFCNVLFDIMTRLAKDRSGHKLGLNKRGDIVVDCGAAATDVVLPEGVKAIGMWAFYNCKALTSVKIPNGVTKIGYEAFRDCEALTTIEIPVSVTNIEEDAFRGCKNLRSIIVSKDNPVYKDIRGALFSKDGKTLIRYPAGKGHQQCITDL